jgi:uncharacterized protein (DUF488 family)
MTVTDEPRSSKQRYLITPLGFEVWMETEGKRRYEEFLKANALPALDYLITATREAPTAILCLEEDASLCHRSVVAMCAAKRASLCVVNL